MTDLTGKRILFVDDELPVRSIVAASLRHLGALVTETSRAEEALELYRPATFDVVLTDYNMLGMKGDELAKAIKQLQPGQKIVMLSGFAEQFRRNGKLPSFLDDLLHKPCKLEVLSAALA